MQHARGNSCLIGRGEVVTSGIRPESKKTGSSTQKDRTALVLPDGITFLASGSGSAVCCLERRSTCRELKRCCRRKRGSTIDPKEEKGGSDASKKGNNG